MKKNFDAIQTENIYADQTPDAPEGNRETAAALERATLSRYEVLAADQEEKTRREAEGRTQGRKGCEMTRINMRFTSENYEYIRTMAALNGQSMREFVNECVKDHRSRNAAKYARITAIKGDFEE